jgi:hypothetical protein
VKSREENETRTERLSKCNIDYYYSPILSFFVVLALFNINLPLILITTTTTSTPTTILYFYSYYYLILLLYPPLLYHFYSVRSLIFSSLLYLQSDPLDLTTAEPSAERLHRPLDYWFTIGPGHG